MSEAPLYPQIMSIPSREIQTANPQKWLPERCCAGLWQNRSLNSSNLMPYTLCTLTLQTPTANSIAQTPNRRNGGVLAVRVRGRMGPGTL